MLRKLIQLIFFHTIGKQLANKSKANLFVDVANNHKSVSLAFLHLEPKTCKNIKLLYDFTRVAKCAFLPNQGTEVVKYSIAWVAISKTFNADQF